MHEIPGTPNSDSQESSAETLDGIALPSNDHDEPTIATGNSAQEAPTLTSQNSQSTVAGPDPEATRAGSSANSAEAPSRSIGPYNLVRKLGEGGMGQVWLAEQTEPVRRTVAIKLIRFGLYDEDVLHRFRAERQSLARMDHPAIAKVFDAGATADGQPYFVMEYVPGAPITQYCDEKRLTIRQRLELFILVCEGVKHAHQKAIIHRDLKPANILVTEVDGKPVPRIIDFGLAKATAPEDSGETMFTQLGAFVGTPGYMSPEQADSSLNGVDTRTDVYSLGVILYVLLAGVEPFDDGTGQRLPLLEMLRRLREDEPPTPTAKLRTGRKTLTSSAELRGVTPKQLQSVLKGDLDWIVMKALEKDRERRYGTPMELASDVERYLYNKPVHAAPPSFAYRASKFMRRNRLALGSATAIALVLVVTSIISISQSIRANREAAVSRAVSDFLENDLLAQAGASKQSTATTKPDPDLKVRAALDRAAQRVQGKFANQPEIEVAIRNTVGSAYFDLGLFPNARKQFERALELGRQKLGANDPETLKSLDQLGLLADHEGKFTEAEGILKQVLEARKRALGSENRETLMTMGDLALVYRDKGEYPQAAALSAQTLETEKRVLGAEDPDTLYTMYILAEVYSAEAKYTEAEALLTQTLEAEKRVLGPEHPDTMAAMHSLSAVYMDEGKFSDADAIQRQALEISKRTLGLDHPSTIDLMYGIAGSDLRESKYGAAETMDAQALEISTRVLGPDHPKTLNILSSLAEAYVGEGKYALAEPLLSRALQIQRRVLGPEHPDILETMGNLTVVYQKDGKYKQAEAVALQALEISKRVLGVDHPITLICQTILAHSYVETGKYAEAEALFQQQIAAETRLASRPELIAATKYDMACLEARRGHKDKALALLGEAIDHRLAAGDDLGMQNDTDLASLHHDPRWPRLVDHAKKIAAAQSSGSPPSK